MFSFSSKKSDSSGEKMYLPVVVATVAAVVAGDDLTIAARTVANTMQTATSPSIITAIIIMSHFD